MTFYTNSYIQETTPTFSDYETGFSIDADSGLGVEGFEEYELEGEFGISEDVYIGNDAPSDGSSGLHAKVGQLLEALAGSQLAASEKSEIRSTLEALQGKINTLAAMSPERYSIEIDAIHSQIGHLETRILGLGEDELGLDFALQEGDTGEADGEYTQEGLVASLQAVEDEIKDLFSDGKITEDLRDELLGRHGRIEGELDLKTANLDMVGEMIEGLRGNLASIHSEFVDSGEPIDAIDGEEDLSKYPETVNRMAAWLKANGSPDIKAKDLVEKAEELGLSEDDLKYPSLPPSENFMTFLTEADPGLKHLMDEYRAQLGSQAATQAAEEEPEMPVYPGLGMGDTTGPMGLMGPGAEWAERLEEQERQAAAESELAPARSAVRDRLYGLLKAIFPDAGLANAVISDTQSPAFNKSDDLVINNINYDIFENATGKLRFAEWAQADA